MSLESLWTLLGVALALDLILAAARAGLLNARLPALISQREDTPETIERTLALLDRPSLRTGLRLAGLILHLLIAAAAWALFLRLTGLAETTPMLIGAVLALALLTLLLEYVVEGRILPNADDWAVRLTWLGRFLDFILSPFSALLLAILGTRGAFQQRISPVTEDELKTWVETEQPDGSLEKGERKMIYSIFQFGDTLCREIMIPRMDIVSLEADATLPSAVQLLIGSGHSRVPVYDDTIDNIIGILYAKDLLKLHSDEAPESIRDLVRPAYYVPEAKKVDELLREMQSRRVHVAIVVDEYGGTAGLVTLEDIVEEIVGEIRDEYDQAEELPYQQVSPDEYLIQGRISLDDFNYLTGAHLLKDNAETLGGFIYGEIGRVPVGGEQVPVDGWTLIVEQVSGRRILKVRARRAPAVNQAEDKEDDSR